MFNLKSMELSEDESLDTKLPIAMSDKPSYPYGLQICLSQDEMAKLGIDPTEATVGSTFVFHAMARVTDVSANDSANFGSSFRLEAQIEQMDVDGDDEADAAPAKRGLAALYKAS